MREIRSLAPQRDEPLPLTLRADDGGHVGLKFHSVYIAQRKKSGEWQQSYEAYPIDGFRVTGWQDKHGVCVSDQMIWIDEYGQSPMLTACFETE